MWLLLCVVQFTSMWCYDITPWIISLSIICTPCGEGTNVSIVCCRYAYCCPEPIHGKIIWHRSSYFVVTICYVQNCELSYNVLGVTENCNHTQWIHYRTGCGIWLVGGKGANVLLIEKVLLVIPCQFNIVLFLKITFLFQIVFNMIRMFYQLFLALMA